QSGVSICSVIRASSFPRHWVFRHSSFPPSGFRRRIGTEGSEVLPLRAADSRVEPLGIGGRSQKVRVVGIARQESQALFGFRFGNQSTARGIPVGERSAFPPIGAE